MAKRIGLRQQKYSIILCGRVKNGRKKKKGLCLQEKKCIVNHLNESKFPSSLERKKENNRNAKKVKFPHQKPRLKNGPRRANRKKCHVTFNLNRKIMMCFVRENRSREGKRGSHRGFRPKNLNARKGGKNADLKENTSK